MSLLSPQAAVDLIRSSEATTRIADDHVAVELLYSSGMRVYEKRLSLFSTVGEIKSKATSFFGADPDEFTLIVKRDGRQVARAVSDQTTLIELNVRSGDQLVFQASAQAAGFISEITDTDRIEKYVMDEEAYDKREGTVRAWKREQAALRAARGEPEPAPPVYDAFEGKVGDRCRLKLGTGTHVGTVRFAGEVPGLRPGQTWVGIELDEPFGKHDGVVKGTRLFTAAPQTGVVVRPRDVELGDFAAGADDFDLEAELAATEAQLATLGGDQPA